MSAIRITRPNGIFAFEFAIILKPDFWNWLENLKSLLDFWTRAGVPDDTRTLAVFKSFCINRFIVFIPPIRFWKAVKYIMVIGPRFLVAMFPRDTRWNVGCPFVKTCASIGKATVFNEPDVICRTGIVEPFEKLTLRVSQKCLQSTVAALFDRLSPLEVEFPNVARNIFHRAVQLIKGLSGPVEFTGSGRVKKLPFARICAFTRISQLRFVSGDGRHGHCYQKEASNG